MNYLPFVSWGIYGGETAPQRANFFASWGLMAVLPGALVVVNWLVRGYWWNWYYGWRT